MIEIDNFRVFKGDETKQKTFDGLPALDNYWYFEPKDYVGDVLWSIHFFSEKEAIQAAQIKLSVKISDDS